MRLCRPRRCVLAVVVLAFIGWVVGAIVLYIETQVDRIFKGSPELRLVTTTPFLENVARIAMRKTGVFSTAVSATDTCAGRVFAHNRLIVTPCLFGVACLITRSTTALRFLCCCLSLQWARTSSYRSGTRPVTRRQISTCSSPVRSERICNGICA